MRQLQASKENLSGQETALLVNAIYNEACCAAVDGQTDEAREVSP